MGKNNKDWVRIYEDWVEIEGTVFYKYRKEGEEQWRYKKTPYTQKPVVQFRLMTPEEYGYLTQDTKELDDWKDLPLKEKL